ncbi:MAG: mechanosensitive ion channel domain-containing protein, partial [Sedimenticola sp.]
NTEGYVRKISIRSTQIQTFDRADVMVPNSELISAQVTNWMLRDLRGRVRAPIGVAYGSDVEKVKEILLDIAHQQPGAILDGSVNMPKVLFLGFGDSALNFELRFIIRNVDEKLQTLSDVNFAIDKAFRENDISIPFPQRDLHLRSSSIDFQPKSSD